MIQTRLYLILLLFCCNAFAQDSIQKADGTKFKIVTGSAVVYQKEKQVKYLLPDLDKPRMIAFKDLSQATSNGKLFKIFRDRKKIKGYYVITQNKNVSLAAISTKKTSTVGGFNVPYTLHEVAVFDHGKILDKVSFTENNDRKNINKRVAAREMIINHFTDCVAVLERLAFFAGAESNLQEGDVVEFLKSPYWPCN